MFTTTLALVIFVFVLLAMTARLPAGMQNAVADTAATIYLGVPKAPVEVFVAAPPPPSTTTTTAVPVPTAPPQVTIPTPITVPPTTATTLPETTSTALPTTVLRSTTTPPALPLPTTPPDSVDEPVTQPPPPPPTAPPPTIPVPTTPHECINPMIVGANAKIEANKLVVTVTVNITGQIRRMQASLPGQPFVLLTRAQNLFLGSLQSPTPVAPGTPITVIACSASVNATVAAHP